MLEWKIMLIALLGSVALATATEVNKCPTSKTRQLESSEVIISKCSKGQCILKRNRDVSIQMKLTPTRDFNELESDILGIILDAPLPFPGYYGTSACPFIYDAEGVNKVGCPLKEGQTYWYKNSFKILPVYPTIPLDVHWGLRDKKGYVACFQVPARIKA